MGKFCEIERKFLVKDQGYREEFFKVEDIVQGYLSSVPERTVRVRIKGDKAYLTIKGLGNDSGITRFEWEKEISVSDAKELIKLCEPSVIDKTRYYVKIDRHVFEVDEFHADNAGLIVAEIELEKEDESFAIPEWLGQEMTGESKYYNASLVKHPYKNWNT